MTFEGTKQMTMFEDLSNEIMYEVFEFLDCYHAYDAFFDLNMRFRTLFIHSPIPLNVNLCDLSKRNFDHYFQFIIKANEDHIKSLCISNPFYTEYFLSLLSIDSSFIRLQNLSLREISSNKLTPLLTVLRSVPSLTSLTITANGFVQDIDLVHRLILALPVLHYCNTSFNWRAQRLSSNIFSHVKSPIRHLIIDSPYDLHSFALLLSCMPDLVRLSCYQLSLENAHRLTRPIVLSKLTHLHLVLSTPFDQFERWMLNVVHSLEVLCISSMPLVHREENVDPFDNDYLDANQWESLISTHMPRLRIFDLQCFGRVDQQDRHYQQTYQILIRKFDSIFWITRGWLFAHQYYEYENSSWLIFRSIHSHKYHSFLISFSKYILRIFRSKKNDFCRYSPNETYFHRETSAQTTPQIVISNPLSSVNYTCRLPHLSQLTLTGESYKTNSYILQLNNLIPLPQLTELVLNCDAFFMNQLLNLLLNTSNLRRLKLLANSRCVMLGADVSNRYATENRNGTEMPYRGLLAVKHVEAILKVCPRLQSLEMNINENFLEQITRMVLTQEISRIHQLCLLGFRDAHYGIIRRLNRILNVENILEQYCIEYIQNTVYIWW